LANRFGTTPSPMNTNINSPINTSGDLNQ
jgi:hypothetical protein